MIERKENGKLAFKTLEFEIFVGELFEQCKTEKEVTFVMENIQQITEYIADERSRELNPDDD